MFGKKMFKTKGMMYTLEAVMAAILILATLISVYSFSKQETGFDAATIKENGYSCIKNLDSRGVLRYYALSNDSVGVRSYFQNCLPRSLNFSINFCASCAPDVPGNKTIVSVNYMIAGEAALFQPSNANLFLWSIV